VRAVELFAEVSRLRTGTGGGHGSHRLSREEIVSLLTTSGRGDYQSSSGEMILKFFNLSDLRVSDIMTPRIAVVAVPDEFDLSEVRKAIVESGYTRLPVYHQNRENLVGLVMAKDLLQDAPDLKSVMRPLPMVPESMKAIRFLEWARRNHTGLAGVVDEYGGFAGVVGPEDLAQELVGAIRDEFDDQSGCIRLSARTWLVAGSTRITHLPAHLEFELKGYKSRSIGGVVTEIAGTIPKTGKELNLGKFRLRVLRAGAKGVELVRITIPGSREESPSA